LSVCPTTGAPPTLIRRAAAGLAVGSAVFIGDISNAFDLCDSQHGYEQSARRYCFSRMQERRSLRARATRLLDLVEADL
jgi:hypothetical protein